MSSKNIFLAKHLGLAILQDVEEDEKALSDGAQPRLAAKKNKSEHITPDEYQRRHRVFSFNSIGTPRTPKITVARVDYEGLITKEEFRDRHSVYRSPRRSSSHRRISIPREEYQNVISRDVWQQRYRLFEDGWIQSPRTPDDYVPVITDFQRRMGIWENGEESDTEFALARRSLPVLSPSNKLTKARDTVDDDNDGVLQEFQRMWEQYEKNRNIFENPPVAPSPGKNQKRRKKRPSKKDEKTDDSDEVGNSSSDAAMWEKTKKPIRKNISSGSSISPMKIFGRSSEESLSLELKKTKDIFLPGEELVKQWLPKLNILLETETELASGPTKVTSWMWIGDQDDADALEYENPLKFTHVVNCMEGDWDPPDDFPKDISYTSFDATDDEFHNIVEDYLSVENHLQRIKNSEGRLFIFSSSGINRAGAIAASALISLEGLVITEAVKKLKAARGQVIRNQGFQKQLVYLAGERGKLA